MRDHMLEQARIHAEKLSTLETEMRSQESGSWTESQMQEYLAEALWTVHFSLWAHQFGETAVPASPKDLEGGPYCPKWPANPFNGWQPIQVFAASDPFSPGDLTYQICPPEFYSFIGGSLRPMAHELGIYAPSLELALNSDAKPMDLNTWATIPEGTLYMAGTYCETAEMTARKLARRNARKQAEKK